MTTKAFALIFISVLALHSWTDRNTPSDDRHFMADKPCDAKHILGRWELFDLQMRKVPADSIDWYLTKGKKSDKWKGSLSFENDSICFIDGKRETYIFNAGKCSVVWTSIEDKWGHPTKKIVRQSDKYLVFQDNNLIWTTMFYRRE